MIYKLKLIERLINKEYLTERERIQWLGAIKKRLETLEEDKESFGKIIQRKIDEFNYVVNQYSNLHQENEKLKEIFNTLVAWLQQEKEKVKLDIKKSTRHGQLANAFGKENIIEAVLEYLTEKGLGNDR